MVSMGQEVPAECGIDMRVGETVDISPKSNNAVRKTMVQQGTGQDCPSYGDKVTFRYTAYLGEELDEDKIFDSTERDGEDFTYECMKGRVIRGFELGILTMKQGERAILHISPEYGFGLGGNPPRVPEKSWVTFDTELINVECHDLSHDQDKSLLKKTLVNGTGYQFPNKGCMIDINIKGECEDNVFIDKDNVKFRIGEGTSELYDIPPFVEDQLRHLKNGEKARLFFAARHAYGSDGCEKYKIKPNTDLIFYIKVNNFEKLKDFWEMTFPEKLDQAEMYKDKGNLYYQRSEYELAEKFYSDALQWIQDEQCAEGNVETRRKHLVSIGLLNLAQAALKLEKYAKARDACDGVLKVDATSVKAHYRRGLALYNMKDFGHALNDFEKVLEMDQHNKMAKSYVAKCKGLYKDAEESAKRMAQKMMSDLGKHVGPDRRYASGMNDIGDWDNNMAHGMMSLEEERAAFGDMGPRNGDNNHGTHDIED